MSARDRPERWSAETRPVRASAILAQSADDMMVLIELHGGKHYALEGVGPRLWELCDGSRSVADIVASLRDEFDADEDRIRSDVFEFLGALGDEALLQPSQERATRATAGHD